METPLRTEDVRDNLDRVRERIARAAAKAGRDPKSVRLVVVSKRFPASAAAAAFSAGAIDLGENYVQEARDKAAELADLPVRWHLIGHLQKNKAKYVPGLFHMVHTVDSAKLAAELEKQCARTGAKLSVLLQVNVGGEAQKSGAAPGAVEDLAAEVAQYPHLGVRGLMCMPPFFDAPDRSRPFFAQLRRLAEDVRAAGIANVSMDELSMGMSGDFEAAILEGATLVRVGTAIFGERT